MIPGLELGKLETMSGRDDDDLIKEVAHKVAAIYTAHDAYVGQERTDKMRKALQEYEATWA